MERATEPIVTRQSLLYPSACPSALLCVISVEFPSVFPDPGSDLFDSLGASG